MKNTIFKIFIIVKIEFFSVIIHAQTNTRVKLLDSNKKFIYSINSTEINRKEVIQLITSETDSELVNNEWNTIGLINKKIPVKIVLNESSLNIKWRKSNNDYDFNLLIRKKLRSLSNRITKLVYKPRNNS